MCTFQAGNIVRITAGGLTIDRSVACAVDISRLKTGGGEALFFDDPTLTLARRSGCQEWHTKDGPCFPGPITVQLIDA